MLLKIVFLTLLLFLFAPTCAHQNAHFTPDQIAAGVSTAGQHIAHAFFPEPEFTSEPSQVRITHMSDVEDLILMMTNDIRQKHGVRRLRPEETLRVIARNHSDDMIRRRFFAHDNPDGHSATDRIASQHRRLIGGVGENIWRYASTVESNGKKEPAYIRLPPKEIAEMAMSGWMRSPGHRENILREQFTHLGAGVSIVKGEVLATQNFGAVRAYLKMSLPKRLQTGGLLNLEMTPYPSSDPVAERYDLAKGQDDEMKGGKPIKQGRIAAEKGFYRLRFYFPDPKGYEVYTGPSIEVR